MYDIYFWTTPNGYKISIFAEETGISYTIKPVNIGKGEQFDPAFLRISPNNRIPALVDHAPLTGGAPFSIFESVQFSFISQRRLGCSSRTNCAVGSTCSNGSSGRWVG